MEKFYPAFSRDNLPSPLDLGGRRTVELQLNTWSDQVDGNPRELPIFHFLARSDSVRQAIYRAVYRFVAQHGERVVSQLAGGLVEGGSLEPAVVAILRAEEPVSETDEITGAPGPTDGPSGFRETVESNLRSLRQYFERSEPEYSVHVTAGRLVLLIRPNSMSEVRVKKLTVGVRGSGQVAETPVRVDLTDLSGATNDQTPESVEAEWLADGALDISRAVANARFATGLDRSIRPHSPPQVNVRWVAGLDADRRRALEERFGLHPQHEVASTTWRYALADRSRANVTAIVRHPQVEDTHDIDRDKMTLTAGRPRYQAPNLERVPRLYGVAFSFVGVPADTLRPEAVDVVFVNNVTGREVEARRVRAHDFGAAEPEDVTTALPHPSRALQEWLAAHGQLRIRPVDRGELLLARGTHRLDRHLVLPRGYNLSIQSGTDLQLGAGVVILVRGGLSIRGSADDPVTVRPIDPDHSFGSVAVVGDGSQRTEVSHLELSGGSDAWLEGARFAGGLSIHYQSMVSVSHTAIQDNYGDDGLSVKYARGVVTDSTFTGNMGDQVDLEYFDGIVRDSRLEGAQTGDPNGDGIDLRGSRVVVINNEIRGAADKAASVGEQSQALFVQNRFGDSTLAVAVKDLSTAYLFNNRFDENRRDVSAYLKKPFFGGGRVVLAGTDPQGLSFDIDAYSTLARIPAGAVERLRPAGMRFERVVESFTALLAVSDGR